MKRNILFVFVLMSLCVTAIAVLQFYYSYTSYKASVITFRKDSNEAFKEAVDSAIVMHREEAIKVGRKWLMDTNNVIITTQWKPGDAQTTFVLKQDDKDYTYGITDPDIPIKLDSVTPEIKEKVVNIILSNIRDQLSINLLVNLTEGLAKAIGHVYYDIPVDDKIVKEQYRLALQRKGIELPFSFNCDQKSVEGHVTQKLNIAISGKSRLIYACFEDTDAYLLGRLKWIIATSLLLMLITLGCFWYTLKTLFNQQKLNRLKDDFISNMTHEIHSPLSSVMITAEAMKEFEMTKEERDTYADIILYQSRKLTTLADEILAGAKLEKKGIELEDTIDLDSLLKNMAQLYKEQAEITYSGDGAVFKGNKNHFERAIANVLDNAVKYNEGEIIKIEILNQIEANAIEITIADNGPGIPDGYKAKVFDQFYRIPTGNVHNVKGYGLGLSYVKKVLLAHKGTVAIKDNNPKGSMFVIRIPYEA